MVSEGKVLLVLEGCQAGRKGRASRSWSQRSTERGQRSATVCQVLSISRILGQDTCVQGVGPTEAALRPGCSWSVLLCPAPPPDLPNRLFSSPSASREVRSELRAWGSSGRRGGDRLFGARSSSPCCSAFPCRLLRSWVWSGCLSGSLEPRLWPCCLSELGGFSPTPHCADE